MKIRRFEVMEACLQLMCMQAASVGVMVGFDAADESKAATAEFKEMGKNVAMQIAAMNPPYLDEHPYPLMLSRMKRAFWLLR